MVNYQMKMQLENEAERMRDEKNEQMKKLMTKNEE